MELIMDAEAANPNARALNYVSLVGGAGDSVTLKDELTGSTYTIKPKIVLNAAGPWIDLANRAIGQQTQFIGGTKGSHILVDNPKLRELLLGNEVFFENKDGRICLIFPMFDKVIIGTTDIRSDIPDPICTDDEVDYMIDLVSYVFPGTKIDRSQIVFQFCGVRPLPHSSASRTGSISRDHSIRTLEPDEKVFFPVLSLIGGKWTTFRAFSEQVADAALQRLGRTRLKDTKTTPIGGGKGYPKTDDARQTWTAALQQKSGLTTERINILFERYGTYASDIALHCAAGDDQPLRSQATYSQREIMFLVQHEKIVHLDDLLLRRSLLAMLGLVTGDLLEEVADILAATLGWSPAERQQEIDNTVQLLQTRHGVSPDKLQAASASVA